MYKKLPKYNNLYINTEDWQLYRIVCYVKDKKKYCEMQVITELNA